VNTLGKRPEKKSIKREKKSRIHKVKRPKTTTEGCRLERNTGKKKMLCEKPHKDLEKLTEKKREDQKTPDHKKDIAGVRKARRKTHNRRRLSERSPGPRGADLLAKKENPHE